MLRIFEPPPIFFILIKIKASTFAQLYVAGTDNLVFNVSSSSGTVIKGDLKSCLLRRLG